MTTQEFIEDYCDFSGDRVYVLFAIARKAENEEITSATEIIFREVLRKPEDIRRKLSKLRVIAEDYEPDEDLEPTFRLYLTANARDAKKAYFNFVNRLQGWMQGLVQGDDAIPDKLQNIDSEWKSELQRPHNRIDNYFIFDVDTKDTEVVSWTLSEVKNKGAEMIANRETPNGRHIITTPFNYTRLELPDSVEVKTDGMVFLEYLKE